MVILFVFCVLTFLISIKKVINVENRILIVTSAAYLF